MDAPPLTLISYSHDSEPHRAAVLQLAQDLRGLGIDAILDRFFPAPPQGWPKWMVDQLHAAAFVLTVCTPTYCRRFEGHEEPGKGLGATLEGVLATQILYEASMLNHKIVPVLFKGQSAEGAVPKVLLPYTRYTVPDQLEALVRHLRNEPEVVPAPVKHGVRLSPSKTAPILPTRQVQSEGSKVIAPNEENMTPKSASSRAGNPTVKKLKQAAKALATAGETAYDSDWKSILGWHAAWEPWFVENLTADEVARVRDAMKKPRGPKTRMVGKKVITLDDPYGDAITLLQNVLQGLLNKYTP